MNSHFIDKQGNKYDIQTKGLGLVTNKNFLFDFYYETGRPSFLSITYGYLKEKIKCGKVILYADELIIESYQPKSGIYRLISSINYEYEIRNIDYLKKRNMEIVFEYYM